MQLPAILHPISSLLDTLLFNDHLLAFLDKYYIEVAATIAFLFILEILIKITTSAFFLYILALLLFI